MDIRITKTNMPKQKPDESRLGFGNIFSDHMFVMPYDSEKGWHDPQILPYGPFSLDPASLVFHYAQECFEGMKAYRAPSGEVKLFRPDQNAKRMATTHRRLCIPEIPEEFFVNAVKKLVEIDKDWVPSAPGTSLYIRPTTIATELTLGVKPSKKYLFYIILSPSGAYYAEGINPVKIYVEDELTRAAPGGTGFVKCGGNYAASLAAQEKAEKLGYGQVLWLDSKERKYIEEVGSMNCFFKINGEIYTAPLDGTVLPGITRMSCIELMKSWGLKVNETKLTIDELIEKSNQGQLEEVFGTGTAAVISPVGELRYKDSVITVNDGKIGDISQKLYDTLTGIQLSHLPDEHGWMVNV